MSESDSFIREVSEEVRQDRMFRLWKKYGIWVVLTIALIVGGTAAWSWKKQRDIAARAERGAAFLAVKPDDIDGLRTLVQSTDGPAKVVAEFRLADALAASGDTKAAADAYDAIASLDAPARYTQLARLEALRLRAPAADPAETISALEPLTAQDAPYRPLALELRAAMELNAGNTEAARNDLAEILADPSTSNEGRARAQALMATIPPAE